MYAGKGFTPGEMTMFGYMTELDHAVGEIMSAFRASGKYESASPHLDRYQPPLGSVAPSASSRAVGVSNTGIFTPHGAMLQLCFLLRTQIVWKRPTATNTSLVYA